MKKIQILEYLWSNMPDDELFDFAKIQGSENAMIDSAKNNLQTYPKWQLEEMMNEIKKRKAKSLNNNRLGSYWRYDK